MLGTTLANLRAHKGRLLLSSVAIVLATAFVAGTFVFTDAMRTALFGAFTEDLGEADVVVTAPSNADVSQEVLSVVREVGGVSYAEGRVTGRAALHYPGGRLVPDSYGTAIVSVVHSSDVRWPEVTAGRLPDQPGEAVLDRGTAQRSGLNVGDTVRVPLDWGGPSPSAGASSREARALRIIGLVDVGDSPRYAGTPFLGVTKEQARALTDDRGYAMILALGADGVPTAELADRIGNAVGSPYQVRTAEEYARRQVSSGLTTGVTAALLAFAGIAMFVAAIVIANTFSILLAQRTREMALLRCVGATRGQVFRSVLTESTALGLAGSAVGVLTGFGLAYGVGAALDARFDSFPFGAVTPSTTAVVVPIAVGVAVTVGAAVLPARAATRIPPVAALRDRGVPTRRAGRVRLALAAVTLLAGAAGLALGALALSSTGGFAVAFAGGVSAFLGVLLAGPVLVPPLVRLMSAAPGRALGTPGRLAAVNAVRNPRRAAATTSALLVGVTLISLMSVGAASLRATVTAALNEQFPVDYMIRSDAAKIPASVVEDVRGVPGLSDVAVVHGVTTRLHGRRVSVSGVDPQKVAAVTSELPALARLDPGEVMLSETLSRRLGIGSGDTLRLGGGGGRVETLTVSTVTGQGAAAAVTTHRDLARAFPDAPARAVFARVASGADLGEVGAAVDRATAGTSVTVTGTAATQAAYTRVLNMVLLVVTALLAVAVLIAVVGIANTLALSVVERTRESALLRALGLTRRQLRGTLSVEAGLMAVVGALLGVALGIVFGWAAVASMLPSSFGVVLAVPGLRLAGLAAAAVVAGLLASVLPARRAARASVVSALADE